MAVQKKAAKRNKKLKKKKQLDKMRNKPTGQQCEKTDTSEGVPSLTSSKTASEDDTMRDVASMPTESFKAVSEKTSLEDTDRQLAGLFSPSDYQKLIEEVVLPAEKSRSFPAVLPSKPPPKEYKSEPAYHMEEGEAKPERMMQLEREVLHLKKLVDQQADELGEARRQLNSLMVEHRAEVKKELLDTTPKFRSEHRLKQEELLFSQNTNTI